MSKTPESFFTVYIIIAKSEKKRLYMQLYIFESHIRNRR